MIIKGDKVVFIMKNGTTKRMPPGYGMMHDPDGKDFPRCSVFIGPVKRTQQPLEGGRKAKAYFGSKYKTRKAIVERIGGSWTPVGEVTEIRYTRYGKHAAPYFHPFKSFSPTLSKCGRFYRLELRNGCIIDDRGYVFP